ncbi:glycosyltransferase [Agriterribacter sp.]|uniref:glycosyltransferase n=1 Tax=Agriterribacter sp. TaxID=2821509 RepID=UPI002B629B4A|nr:glycosyltransferase [Agriterribacter sp.]HRP57361.1 glycosyltransferase [Agriterribacter sp.]
MKPGIHFPKILVAPLDWGLGHATRCIPLINELVRQGCFVWLAAGGSSLQLLREQFPQLPFLPLKGYDVFYHNTKSNFKWTMIRQIPKIAASIKQEHNWLKKAMDDHHFDVIISDNRYGLSSKKALSVFITHQLGILTGMGKLADKLLQRINYRYIRNFDECWVPDFKGQQNLAGKLSRPSVSPPNAKYIGALSRFQKKEADKKYDLLIVLSGPEPRRTIFEQLLLKELKTYDGKVLLVRGLIDGIPALNAATGAEVVDFLSSDALNTAICQSEWVICRSGYTSVMDLVQLEQKAILVPTPGQPEQEYLAQWLHRNEIFYAGTEASFSLRQSLQEAKQFPFLFTAFQPFLSGYKTHIEQLVQKLKLMRNGF